MHLIIFSHSYPGHFERVKEELDKRGYIDDTTEEKVRYGAIWREVKLWDVLIPEGCKADFLNDLASFHPGQTYLKKHTKGLDRLLQVLCRLLRFFGIKSVDVPNPDHGRYPGRNVNGLPVWVWLIPIGDLDELRDEKGDELW